jgi:alpha-ketoglutarate-dependent taurine dioxygenase
MKTRSLQNYGASRGLEAYDIDWNNREEVIELGRLCASECIVFVNDCITTEQLYETMIQWGGPSQSLAHRYVLEKKLEGRHWRELVLNLFYISSTNKDQITKKEITQAVSMVSYKKDERGRPAGIFQNGELDWHSDQCATDDGQRVIGLQSVSDTNRSQTQFLCTHDAYESLSSDMRSLIKELYVKHKWRDHVMAPGLDAIQTLLIHYNMVPLDGMETRLYHETATGLSGIKMPSHSYDGFVGMSRDESDKILKELAQSVYQDKYVYTQNWQDGQIVFMDQEITLHKRPTNVKDGDRRTMARSITYLNHLYPDAPQAQIAKQVRWNGHLYDLDEFAKMIDADRLKTFMEQEHEGYIGDYKLDAVAQ